MKSAILGTIEIVALARADRDPVRHRRRAVPRRVRQDRQVRERRPLLRRRDDRRARRSSSACSSTSSLVVTGVGGTFAGLEGLDRARAADAAGRHALGRGRAEPRARLAARGRARARRAALAGRLQHRAARRRCPGSSPARCSPSPAPRARPRRCCSRRSSSTATSFDLGEPDELAADPDLQRRAPGRRTDSSSARGAPPLRSSSMILFSP